MKHVRDAWKKVLCPPQYKYEPEYELDVRPEDHNMIIDRRDFQITSPINKA